MFCERCGTKIPDGQNQCPNCHAVPKPVQQGAYYPQQINQPAGFQLNTPGGMPVRPRKNKSGAVVALLVGGVVLAVLAVILVAVFSGVFASPEGRLERLEKTNAKLIAEVASQAYGDYLDSLEESFNKMEKGTGSRVDVTLDMDQTLLTGIVAPLVGTDVSSLDLSWLDNVVLRMDSDLKGDQTSLACGIGVNNTVLATVDMLADLAENELYLGIPELSGQYVYMDLEQMGVSLDQARKTIEPMKTLAKELPSEKDVKKMLSTYLNILFSYVDEVEKVQETVTVGEQTRELTVLKAKITEQKLTELFMELAKTAQSDETLKQLVQAVNNYMNAVADGAATEDLYAQLQAELAYTLADMEESLEYADPENYIVLSNYVSSGMIVGRSIEPFSSGVSDGEQARYLFLPEKDGGAFEVAVPELKLAGKIADEDMEVTLHVEGQEMLTLKAEKLEMKSGALNGTLRLLPGKAMLQELTYSGVPASALKDVCLQLTVEGSDTDATTQLQLTVGGTVFAEVSVHSKEEKYEPISAPGNVISADSEDDLMTWVTSVRFDTLIKNMQTAGLPNDYVQLVQQVEMLLQMQAMPY